MTDRAADELRYTAFLSYSHKDTAAASRLHRRLEGYRLPKRLVGRETPLGSVPARLCPIFRDRDELPAASDLTETVREALRRSGALIVLCSPDAASSLWVAEEIETFRRLHPGRPILAVLLDGTPSDAFPPVLRAFGSDGAAQEPLAADFRREGDGSHLGLLKLVAGVTGLPLDDLVQRDAQRRLRRVTAITIAALTAMLIMAALTAFALRARSEAERQRAEAEGLIEFMLTDLRDRLKGVGRLDAMAAVNARALRYYGDQRELAELTDESLGRRTRILHAIGHDNLERHDLAAALAAFREAHQMTSELVARSPEDAERLAEHARSEAGLGRVYEMQDDWPMAQRHYSAYAAAADRLVAIEPDNPDHMMKVASGAVDLGNVQFNGTRDYAAAQLSYEKAVMWFGRAARARPGDVHIRLAEANAYGWLADSFYVRSLWRRSLASRLRQLAIVERLHRAEPANADILFRLAAARRGVAHSYLRAGERANARNHVFEAYRIAAALASREPDNAQWSALRTLLGGDLVEMNLGLPPGATVSGLRREQLKAHQEVEALHH